MPELAPQIDLDVGLLQISIQSEAERPAKLPSSGSISPASRHYELKLDEVLYAPASQEESLLEALQPEITHREILQPWVFNAMSGEVMQWLKTHGKRADGPQDRRKVRRASRTLEEFSSLLTLFKRFQHALHRG